MRGPGGRYPEEITMKKLFFALALGVLLAVGAFGQQPTPVPYDKLKVGDIAPDFTLTDLKGTKVKLSDFRGKSNVVLAFYVFAFTGG